MNSAGVTVSDSPTPANLFDEFEEAFQNCLAPLMKEDPLNGINQEEIKVNAETNRQRILELAHRMEAAFLQKRLLLSVQKPELLLMEENHEMRIEISRKDELIKKQTEKLSQWQNTLADLINSIGTVPSHGPRVAGMPAAPNQAGLPTGHLPMMSGAGAGPPRQPMGVVGQSGGSVSLVGGLPHTAIPHSMSSSMTMNTISHQSMMGQVSSSGSAMGPMGQGTGGYSPITSMGASVTPMHGGSVGGGPPTSMGPMGGTQGPGPGGVNSTVVTTGPTNPGGGGGMFHGGGPSMGMNQQSQGGLQGPLAYLEKTTTNIGMPEGRR